MLSQPTAAESAPLDALVSLWNEGCSLVELGRQYGMSKGQVACQIAKARRRGLTVRFGAPHNTNVQRERNRGRMQKAAVHDRGVARPVSVPAPVDPEVPGSTEPAAPAGDAVLAREVPVPRPRPEPHPDAAPRTLIGAPLGTCRVVVGQNAKGADLYCCGPVPAGRKISCCEIHTRFIYAAAPSPQAGAMKRADFTLQHMGKRS